ncbi:MAG: aminotransferase class V-fold PLP-dependent enzyme, partial [Chloroflexota bacterium]|nr:aminotransferase class V-fold PLP-dependent enzyme [Chloroflexota bacterium]
TPKTPGLAGLGAGVQWVQEHTVEAIRAQEMALAARLVDGLRDIPGVVVYGGAADTDATGCIATVSFNIEGIAPSEVGLRLDEKYGIMCRVGLHCSPAAHKTIGTFPQGTVRFSLGALNTTEEIDRALSAIEELSWEIGR